VEEEGLGGKMKRTVTLAALAEELTFEGGNLNSIEFFYQSNQSRPFAATLRLNHVHRSNVATHKGVTRGTSFAA
jgi:hypothetical protein